jgi:hypothetical protein
MTSRRTHRDQLIELAGPLGPFRLPEERVQDGRAWLESLDEGDLDELLAIAADATPHADLHPAWREAFDGWLADAIGAVARKVPEAALAGIARLLPQAHARPTLIDALGAAAFPEALALLRPLVGDVTLNRESRIRLADAIGSIGGPEARALLEALRDHASGDAELSAEIDAVLANLRARQ